MKTKNVRTKLALIGLIVWMLSLGLSPAFSAANAKNLTQPSGYSAEELRRGLLHALKDHADLFVEAERRHGVSAVFLAAVAGVESGWGRHCFLENNFFGWGGKSFSSPEEGIDFVASALKSKYLTPGGGCYRGLSVYDVGVSYSENPKWAREIESVMAEIERRIGASSGASPQQNTAPVTQPPSGSSEQSAGAPPQLDGDYIENPVPFVPVLHAPIGVWMF